MTRSPRTPGSFATKTRSEPLGELHDRRVPARRIFVLLVHRIHVDRHLVADALDAEPIHAPRRPTADELTIRLILRMVLRALEPVVGVVPAQRGVLVRTGEIERVNGVLPAHENHLLVV